ncbi:MAG: two-component system chemotaxis response regulator CheY [Psychroserpens sp.]|jgi:two-component system chemotaxis response regulator CheY
MNPSELSLLVVEPSDLQRKIIIKGLAQQYITQVAEANILTEGVTTMCDKPFEPENFKNFL